MMVGIITERIAEVVNSHVAPARSTVGPYPGHLPTPLPRSFPRDVRGHTTSAQVEADSIRGTRTQPFGGELHDPTSQRHRHRGGRPDRLRVVVPHRLRR